MATDFPLISLHGIHPAEAGEAAEVRIGRGQFGLVLNGEGGEVSIGGEIASNSNVSEQPKQDERVMGTRSNDANSGESKPGLDTLDSEGWREGIRNQSGAGGKPDETEQSDPGETNRTL